MRRTARRSLPLLGVLFALLLGGQRIARATTADDGSTTITVSGPATATVGQTVTYSVVLSGDTGAPYVDVAGADLTASIPAGATNITVIDPNPIVSCAPQFFATSPASFTSCAGYVVPAGGSSTLTITLTLTSDAAPTFTVSASSAFLGGTVATASQTTVVSGEQATTAAGFSFTPLTPGANFDPRCAYGCPPGGLP